LLRSGHPGRLFRTLDGLLLFQALFVLLELLKTVQRHVIKVPFQFLKLSFPQFKLLFRILYLFINLYNLFLRPPNRFVNINSLAPAPPLPRSRSALRHDVQEIRVDLCDEAILRPRLFL